MTEQIKAESERVIQDLAASTDITPNSPGEIGSDEVDGDDDLQASESTESEFAHDAAVNDAKESEEANANSKT